MLSDASKVPECLRYSTEKSEGSGRSVSLDVNLKLFSFEKHDFLKVNMESNSRKPLRG